MNIDMDILSKLQKAIKSFYLQKALLWSVCFHGVLAIFVLALGLFDESPAPQHPVVLHSIRSKKVNPNLNTVTQKKQTNEKDAVSDDPQPVQEHVVEIDEGTIDPGIYTAKQRYLEELRIFFQDHLVYPALSRSMREKAVIEVTFTIFQDGRIENATLYRASSFQRLNQAALDLVRRSKIFKPFPPEMTERYIRLTIPIDYGS